MFRTVVFVNSVDYCRPMADIGFIAAIVVNDETRHSFSYIGILLVSVVLILGILLGVII